MNTDSSSWISLARIVRPQGRHGEVVAELWTDFPERFADRKQVFLAPPARVSTSGTAQLSVGPKPAEIVDFRLSGARIVLHFAGVDSIEAADALRDYEVVIEESERAPLDEDAAYISDLIGCEVFDADQPVGRIVKVDREASHVDLLVVEREDGSVAEIPFVQAFLVKLDVRARRIAMQLPEGLLAINVRKTEVTRKPETDRKSDASQHQQEKKEKHNAKKSGNQAAPQPQLQPQLKTRLKPGSKPVSKSGSKPASSPGSKPARKG